MILRWMFNCPEVNRMASAGLDTDLPLLQRAGIRLHLIMCVKCARIHKQLLSLRAYGRYLGSESEAAAYLLRLTPEARQRIITHLLSAWEQMADSSSTPNP